MNFKKLFFVFGALGILLSSCSKIAEVENINESTGLPCVITATFDATRTSVDDNWNTTWNENDEMTVYVTRESSRSYNYGYSQFTYKGNGKFDGTVNKDICSPFNWFAVYPSFKTSSSTAKNVTAEIEHPASQTMTGNTNAHIAGANDPIFGYALGVEKDPSIRMHHIASVIDVNVTNGSDKAIKVTKVEFTAPGKIAGKFTADVNLLDGEVENPEWIADDSAVNTVSLSVSDGAQIAKNGNGHFYAAIHPISAKGNYTIKVTATSDGKTYVAQKTVNAELAFKAGKYRTLNYTFIPGEPEPDQKCYEKVISAPQDWSGTYIIVDESEKKAFDENAGSYASSVTINDGKVLWNETVAKYQVTISPSSVSGMYDIKTVKGKYMYSYNSGRTTLNDSKTQSSNTYYNSLSISGGDVTMYSTRGSDGSVNYFGYVSSTSDNPNGKNFGYKKDATTRKVQLYKLKDGSPEPPTPSTEKTYTKVTSKPDDWSGTYLIVDENSKNAFAYDQSGYKTSVTINSSKIVSNELENYEVTISVASGSDATHYDVKTSNGKYLYRSSSSNFLNDSNTYNSNKYYAKIGEEGFISLGTKYSRGTEYFFSYSSSAFGFGSDKNATIQLYKLQGSSPTPTPVTASLDIENEKLAAYLDAVEKNPYFTNNTFGSYSSSYTSSLMKDNSYYSGSSSSNRLDQPAPVVLTWTGNATKVEVFTSSSKTTASKVASQTFTSSSFANIYNLIPGQKYYYTASNGSATVATGDFTPEGRRRMIKVSSTFSANSASNCRDLGGLPTVDGKKVKYGLIYRGSNIDNIDNDSNAKDVFLNTMGIKWDIDLRASSEKRSAPTLSGVSKGTQSYSASFDDNNLRSKTKMAITVKEIIDAINKTTPEPVYIHCRIGSDRTGYVCLLIEALIGVTQNYCDTDYEITSFAGNVTGTRFRVDNTAGGGMYRSGIQYFADFSGTTLHDKVYNFVTSSSGLNISKTDVDKFISRMTE